ncbi:MAG: alpha/beta fold hydrolase [Rhodospirillaceae bacterium]|nr:alpha/beta fold hydrolase [Rhodospirillaceae bacterium]
MQTYTVKTKEGAAIALFRKPAQEAPNAMRTPILYVHGANFPTRLSIGFPFDGFSGIDDLSHAGFDVWSLDFLGYGDSDRYPPTADQTTPKTCGRTADAVSQIETAADFIAQASGVGKISIVAHSWGTLPAGSYCGSHPERVERFVMFGPIALREGTASAEPTPPQLFVTVPEQHARFTADVPQGHPPVLAEANFPEWGERYLDSDPTSRMRVPHAVAVPSGPAADIRAAWSGLYPHDPGKVLVPTLIVRGEWDSLCNDADARWLFDALCACPEKQDVKISHATHLMHLERNRFALYEACRTFLARPCPDR